jgi:Fur family ferric uptake transcriptional regulator
MDPEVLERLDTFIRKKGLRRTGQRDVIVRSAFSSDDHFTADELFDRVRKTDASASRATVYRTLSLMVEAGLLREIELGDNHKTYDPNFIEKPAHNHLVCIDCGRVTEFEDSHVELLNDCITFNNCSQWHNNYNCWWSNNYFAWWHHNYCSWSHRHQCVASI